MTLPPLNSKTYRLLSTFQKSCRIPADLAEQLALGADPNQLFDFNHLERPLASAINAAQPESIHLLLAAGADPNLPIRGMAPVAMALGQAHQGQAQCLCVIALLESPRLHCDSNDPLLAAASFCPELVSPLARRGFNPNAIGSSGKWTCLGEAIGRPQAPSLSYLQAMLAAGALPEGLPGLYSPLARCLIFNPATPLPPSQSLCLIIKALLSAGADPRFVNPCRRSCLEIAEARARDFPASMPSEITEAIRARALALDEKDDLVSCTAQGLAIPRQFL